MLLSAKHQGRRADVVVVLVLCASNFLLVLDSAIVNVALASIGRDLTATAGQLTWVVNAYVLAFGGLLLLGGRLTDLVGPRRVLLSGMGVFAVASALGAVAPSVHWLVAARALQGLGAALVGPTLLALAVRTFPAGERRTRTLGWMAAASGAGGASGLVAGGLLTQGFGWRSVFWVNVPVAAVILALAQAAVRREARPVRSRGLDVAGATTVTLGLAVLVGTVVEAPHTGWLSGRTVSTGLVALLLLLAFVALERRAPDPLVPLTYLRSRAVVTGTAVVALTSMSLFPMWFVLALDHQVNRGYDPVRTALAITPLVLVLVVLNSRAPALLRRLPARPLLVGGLLLAAAGAAWMSRSTPGDGYVATLPALLVTAVGFGVALVPGMVTATAGVAAESAGLASGVLHTAQHVAGAFGLAAAMAVVSTARLTDGLLISAGAAVLAALAALLHRGPTVPTRGEGEGFHG